MKRGGAIPEHLEIGHQAPPDQRMPIVRVKAKQSIPESQWFQAALNQSGLGNVLSIIERDEIEIDDLPIGNGRQPQEKYHTQRIGAGPFLTIRFRRTGRHGL